MSQPPIIVHGTVIRDDFVTKVREACDRLLSARSAGMATVQLAISIEGACPVPVRGAVLFAVEELVRNAIQHGFYGRVRGRVVLRIVSRPYSDIEVHVSDDGWGFGADGLEEGRGFASLRALGRLRLDRCHTPSRTGATAFLIMSAMSAETSGATAFKRCAEQNP